MCGRYGLGRPEKLDWERFGISEPPPLEPRFNITPASDIPVLRERRGERRLDLVVWGFIPVWAKDPTIGRGLANARAESAHLKPAFRDSLGARRCLVPADVFYEWQARPGVRARQPFAVRNRDGAPFTMAGVWDRWRSPDERWVISCAILTTDANAMMAPIHDRMPVIVDEANWGRWLSPETSLGEVRSLLRPCPDDVMEGYAVSTWVNSPDHDDERCIEPPA